MKTLAKSTNYLKTVILALTIVLGITTFMSAVLPSYTDTAGAGDTHTKAGAPQQAGDAQQTGGGSFSVTDLGDKATNTISKVQSVVVRVAAGVGTLAIICTLALMLFTHDDRKISGYIKICVTIAIAMAVILLVNAGAVVDIIQDLTQQTFN